MTDTHSKSEAAAPKRFLALPWKKIAWISAELCVVALLVAVVFFQRLLELEKIEIGGDALKVWEFSRNLVMGGEFPARLNHHTSRFGLVIPTMLSQAFFGTQSTSYYIGPLLAAVLLTVWVYLVGRRLSGPIAGAVGALALLAFEPTARASSQILPEAFGPMYTAFAIYAALLYSDAESRTGRWLALVAVGFGIIFAYGAKMVYLFYAPGLAFLVWFGGSKGSLLPDKYTHGSPPSVEASRLSRLWYWLRTSKLVVPVALTAVVLLLALVETVILSSVGEASRLKVVEGSHGGGGARGPRINEVGDFFALYTRAPAEWVQAFFAGAVAWLGLAAFGRDKRSKLVALVLFIYVLLQTFVVRRLSPLTPWFQPHPRYLLAMTGPLAMVLGLFVGDAITALMGGKRESPQTSWKVRASGLVVTAALFLSAGWDLPERWNDEWEKRSAWHKTKTMSEQLTAAYDAGLPIVSESPMGKPVWAAAAVFIDPQSLLDDEAKPIPSSGLMRRFKKRGRYMARAVRSLAVGKRKLDNAVEKRTRGRRCAIVLRQSVRFISGRLSFPKECLSLEKEFETDPHAGDPPESRSKRPNRRAGPGLRQRRR